MAVAHFDSLSLSLFLPGESAMPLLLLGHLLSFALAFLWPPPLPLWLFWLAVSGKCSALQYYSQSASAGGGALWDAAVESPSNSGGRTEIWDLTELDLTGLNC